VKPPAPVLDLKDMTALQLVEWLRTRPIPAAAQLIVAAVAAGITDLSKYTRNPKTLLQSMDELNQLTDHGQRPLPEPLQPDDLNRIRKVGHRVYLDDRDNVTDWESLMDLVHKTDQNEWISRLDEDAYGWDGHKTTRRFIAALLAAGRGPAYGRQLVQAAAQHHVAPDTYGFGPLITPAAFADLAQAGVDGPELDRLLEAGLTIPEVLSFAHAECPAGAVIAAQRSGIDKDRWQELTAGMNPTWFPLFDTSPDLPMDPIEDGALGRTSYTWQQLRELTDHGWSDVGLYPLMRKEFGLISTPAEAVAIAKTGLGYHELGCWNANLSHPRVMWPDWCVTAQAKVDLINRLRAAGITYGSITDYRLAGCQNADDILTAAKAGIDPKRVKHLRALYGQKAGYDRTKRIPTLEGLLDCYRRELAGTVREPAAAGAR
jgi:hypothetical protein